MNKQFASFVAMSLLPVAAVAHPGHDHSHWMSNPIHAVTILAVGSLIGVGVVAYRKRAKKDKES